MIELSSFYTPWYGPWGVPFMALGIVAVLALVLWSVVWKGLGLWKSARNGHKVWFVVLLLVNTVGILEILYIYVFSKKKNAQGASQGTGSSL